MKLIKLLLLNFIALFNIDNALAASSPIVLYDSGKTVDAVSFYPFEKPTVSKLQAKYLLQNASIFPVKTRGMSVGNVTPRKIQTKLHTPVCIIGDDDTSKRYLSLMQSSLERLGAICYAVNVASESNFNDLQRIVPKISIIPTNGNELVELFNMRHYPVLITSKSIK